MAEKTERRTIRHSLFTYTTEEGGSAIAFRGETVDLLPADVKRGDKFDAFTDEVGDEQQPPTASRLAPLAADASKADADAWVVSGPVNEIMAAVNDNPDLAKVVLAAEQRRGDAARRTLLEALTRLQEG